MEEKKYKLKIDFITPTKTIRAGVVKSVSKWKNIFTDLSSYDFDIKTDWFECVNESENSINAEELLRYLKKCVEDLNLNGEAIITPTMYNPTELQYDVSFIIMEKVKGGTIPRFNINVKDLTKRNIN